MTEDSKAVRGHGLFPPSLKTSAHTYDPREAAGPQVRGQPSSEGPCSQERAPLDTSRPRAHLLSLSSSRSCSL